MSDEAVKLGKATCIGSTKLALKVEVEFKPGDVRTLWVPKSAVHDDSEVYDEVENSEGQLVVKRWHVERLAKEFL